MTLYVVIEEDEGKGVAVFSTRKGAMAWVEADLHRELKMRHRYLSGVPTWTADGQIGLLCNGELSRVYDWRIEEVEIDPPLPGRTWGIVVPVIPPGVEHLIDSAGVHWDRTGEDEFTAGNLSMNGYNLVKGCGPIRERYQLSEDVQP